ncbi:hypothetical protein [Methylobacterium indicum]|nr:hypothetical protein [Methylobacterium indicum]
MPEAVGAAVLSAIGTTSVTIAGTLTTATVVGYAVISSAALQITMAPAR